MHLAAVLGPGQGEGAHGGGLPGAGRGDRQLQPGTGGAHLPDQRSLPGIQGGAVRRHLQQRQIHRRLVDDCPVAAAGGGDEALLGVEDPLRGVEVGAGDGVDRGAVGAPQRFRFLDAVIAARPGRPTGDRSTSSTSRSTSASARSAVHVGGADLALGFGADMPHLPGGAVFLHHGQDPVGRLGDPARRRRSWRSRRPGRAPSAPSPRRRRVRPALLRLRPARWRVARPGSGVRVWRRGSPRSPAAPGAALRPGSAAGHDHAGTGWRVRRGGC